MFTVAIILGLLIGVIIVVGNKNRDKKGKPLLDDEGKPILDTKGKPIFESVKSLFNRKK